MNDPTLGLALRTLRRRRGWRQADLAREADCSQALVSNLERGHLDRTPVGRLRDVFAAFDARVLLEARWAAPIWTVSSMPRMPASSSPSFSGSSGPGGRPSSR